MAVWMSNIALPELKTLLVKFHPLSKQLLHLEQRYLFTAKIKIWKNTRAVINAADNNWANEVFWRDS